MNDERVHIRFGTRCPRCGAGHWGTDSTVCDACWVDMGQRSLWEDEEEEDG